MTTALLRVASQDDVLRYSFEVPGSASQSAPRAAAGPSIGAIRQLEGDAARFWVSMEARRIEPSSEHASRFVEKAFPDAAAALTGEIRRWAISTGEATLAVLTEGDDPVLHGLPWELLPLGLGLRNLLVLRTGAPPAPEPRAVAEASPRNATQGGRRMMSSDDDDRPGGALRDGGALRGGSAVHATETLLVVGSSRYRGRSLAGVERELQSLPQRFRDGRFQARALVEPDEAEFLQALAELEPSLIHLTLAEIAIDSNEQDLLVFSGKPGVEPQISVSSLASVLRRRARKASSIVLNACQSHASARTLSRETDATTIGWRGYVNDQDAADFSLFFYARLAEGKTPVEAVRAYLQRLGDRPAASIPVVHVSVPPAEKAERRDAAPERRWQESYRGGLESGQLSGSIARGDAVPFVAIRMELQPAINPAMLTNGMPPLVQLAIDAKDPIPDAWLQITCDTGGSLSVYRELKVILSGGHPVVTDNIHFPNLYDLSEKRTGRRRINFTASVYSRDKLLAEETQSVSWMDRREWLDHEDTWAYIPAFVMPLSVAVQDIMTRAAEIVKGSEGGGDLCGYLGSDDDVLKQMKAIFRALHGEPLKIKYAAPPASRVYVPGTKRPAGQFVRTPEEIVANKLGTCHDLSLLFASCAEYAGLYPLVVLIKGHTFFGFWKSKSAHKAFWEQANAGSPIKPLGDEWLIRTSKTLKKLLELDQVEFLEATHVAYTDKEYGDARTTGAALVGKLTPDRLDVAVDISASRRYIQPL